MSYKSYFGEITAAVFFSILPIQLGTTSSLFKDCLSSSSSERSNVIPLFIICSASSTLKLIFEQALSLKVFSQEGSNEDSLELSLDVNLNWIDWLSEL